MKEVFFKKLSHFPARVTNATYGQPFIEGSFSNFIMKIAR